MFFFGNFTCSSIGKAVVYLGRNLSGSQICPLIQVCFPSKAPCLKNCQNDKILMEKFVSVVGKIWACKPTFSFSQYNKMRQFFTLRNLPVERMAWQSSNENTCQGNLDLRRGHCLLHTNKWNCQKHSQMKLGRVCTRLFCGYYGELFKNTWQSLTRAIITSHTLTTLRMTEGHCS